jgi:hypothetical protein
MRRFLIAISWTALCAAPAAAADDDIMAGFYGNTIISTGGIVRVRTHYRADHTFDLVGSTMFMSGALKGTWALDGKGHVCRTAIGNLPPNVPNPSCSPIEAHKVGDSWKSKDGKQTYTLKAGIL